MPIIIATSFISVIIAESGKIVRHERAWCYREGVRNCTRDGGGPPGVGL